jgi:hypothetical protein
LTTFACAYYFFTRFRDEPEIIKKGISIFEAEGRVTLPYMAGAMSGSFNIQIKNKSSGVKAIDRAIKEYDPTWSWSRNILPLIKSKTLLS